MLSLARSAFQPLAHRVQPAAFLQMPRFMSEIRYSKSHEWVSVDGDVATVGISDHAQEALGEIVFVDLPEVGASFEAGESFGAVESVKAASDIYCPIGGEVVEVNEALADAPTTINESPEADGWMIKLKTSESTDGLMDAAAFQKHLEEEGH